MGYTIYSGKYENGTMEQKRGFIELFGEDHIEYKFDLYFHWFNIVHEIGHCILDSKSINIDKVQEELFVNRFAVAYWNEVNNNNLEKLKKLMDDVLSKIPSPIPQGVSFSDFFSGIWGTEAMNNVMMYGYFQIACVAEAFKSIKSLDSVLSEIGCHGEEVNIIKYSLAINSENSKEVIKTCIKNLESLGIDGLNIDIELVENPEIQCCRKN